MSNHTFKRATEVKVGDMVVLSDDYGIIVAEIIPFHDKQFGDTFIWKSATGDTVWFFDYEWVQLALPAA